MKIMFVCLGNICRSPMAEYIFKTIDQDNKFIVTSSGISDEEYGNDISYDEAEQYIHLLGNALHFDMEDECSYQCDSSYQQILP